MFSHKKKKRKTKRMNNERENTKEAEEIYIKLCEIAYISF